MSIHAGSCHKNFRGSKFISRKLSRKLPWDLFLDSSVEDNSYLFFLTYIFSSVKASVKASVNAFVEANLLPRKLP